MYKSGGALGVQMLNSATTLIQRYNQGGSPMETMYYIGLDVHKKTISYCVKDGSGRIYGEGSIPATRLTLDMWMKTLPQPWTVAMEATIFTAWIYDHLKPHAAAVKVAHPLMLRAIAVAKKKNKIAVLLMEAGVSYNKQKLHKVGYFRELLATNQDIDEGLKPLLRLCREMVVRLGKTESALVRSLERDSLLVERVERLITIAAVGPITALTWALEVGDVQRFSSIKKAISYCGLCGAEKSSANITMRTPLSKQRNKHLQTVLIEAAKMAPRNSPELAMVYEQEKQKGNANRATLAVARKMVAYLVAVDRRQKGFLVVENQNRTAA